MPFEGAKQCTATAKSTGERCQNPAVTGWDVCRMHGAGTPKNGTSGGAPPKHGRYAAKRRESLQEKIEEYRREDDPASLWEEVALLRALLQEWLSELETVDEDTVGVVLDLQDSIRRTLNTINKIQTRTALTQAEVEYLQARMADVLKTHVPKDRRADAIEDLKALTTPSKQRRN
ncbi:MAG: hypothetical protein BRD55_04770 [Bacteroidetes bacterium SW_9_63_38]|nr:MAG: hypothetical protein BRD55_04770 [Bacteroidetes bacterium SW_9_63_38]